jgi:hypothetical protein
VIGWIEDCKGEQEGTMVPGKDGSQWKRTPLISPMMNGPF